LIEGTVTEDGVPAIEVEVGSQRWQAIVDTGFNGELELPERLRSQVRARFVGRVTSLLAANQPIEEDVFLVDFPFDGRIVFPFDGRIVRAQATFADGDTILIGTGLLRDYRLQVDSPAWTVAIART
jgi:predicted aspartyl protease